ncbi:cobalamin B12-binding domain-containing protein [Methanohalophilus mahii]|uniref:Cobalamin B12-binding domain protein n=1 Tax=Methanohalophilus mahii (strain ATCC 35705 / DSM 5219 / SLP) TaxID=547558 RepID=D5EAQ3_METMS|nr:cobalamin-dependent protein [Methanohalophilus mahii]ADE36254.1 cobalamin B12-binding domain protein [Methanohalophilus mahii DSM 5219]
MTSKEEILGELYKYFIETNEKEVYRSIDKWFEKGYEEKQLLFKLIEAQEEVARRFEEEECYLANLMNSTIILQKSNKLITEKLANEGIAFKNRGTVVIGTVKNDTHDLGKNIASCRLQITGFRVIDLGRDLHTSEIVDATIKNKADILAVSSMTSITMNNLKEIVDLLRERGYRENVKIMVSGAPVTQEYADSIGADAYVRTASEAVETAENFIKQKD